PPRQVGGGRDAGERAARRPPKAVADRAWLPSPVQCRRRDLGIRDRRWRVRRAGRVPVLGECLRSFGPFFCCGGGGRGPGGGGPRPRSGARSGTLSGGSGASGG